MVFKYGVNLDMAVTIIGMDNISVKIDCEYKADTDAVEYIISMDFDAARTPITVDGFASVSQKFPILQANMGDAIDRSIVDRFNRLYYKIRRALENSVDDEEEREFNLPTIDELLSTPNVYAD